MILVIMPWSDHLCLEKDLTGSIDYRFLTGSICLFDMESCVQLLSLSMVPFAPAIVKEVGRCCPVFWEVGLGTMAAFLLGDALTVSGS